MISAQVLRRYDGSGRVPVSQFPRIVQTRCQNNGPPPHAIDATRRRIDPDTNKATSAAVADVLEAELGVPKGRYYINFFDSERSNMGYNGGTF